MLRDLGGLREKGRVGPRAPREYHRPRERSKPMVVVEGRYLGDLRCEARHGPSGAAIATDAPADNMGKGESFSPTDLVGTALGTCILTTMAIVAERRGIAMKGATLRVDKHMADGHQR